MTASDAEIDENLIRHNLTAAQEAAAIARRKVIYEELHPETKAEAFNGNRHTGSLASDNLSFANETASATGKDRRTIERAAARGAALGPVNLLTRFWLTQTSGIPGVCAPRWGGTARRTPRSGRTAVLTGRMLPSVDNIHERAERPTGTSVAVIAGARR